VLSPAMIAIHSWNASVDFYMGGGMSLFLPFGAVIAAIPREAGADDIEQIGDSGKLVSTAT
jgi:F0F1-type ATP synthase assembly protein I